MPEPYGVRPRLMKGASPPPSGLEHGHLQDYNPIVAEGDRPVPTWRQLLRRFELPGGTVPLPEAPPGCVTVRYPFEESLPWQFRSRYVIVDLTDHPMRFEFSGLSPDGYAGFVIVVETMVRVVDPRAVADRRIRSMRFHVFPPVSAQVIHALSQVPSAGRLSVASLNDIRRRIAQEVRRRLVPGVTLGMEFFRVMPVNVTVGYDEGTAAHLDELVAVRRKADLSRLRDGCRRDEEVQRAWSVDLEQSFTDPPTLIGEDASPTPGPAPEGPHDGPHDGPRDGPHDGPLPTDIHPEP